MYIISIYYGDERKISAMHEIIDNMFVFAANRIIDEKGYAYLFEVIDAVRAQINDLYWVDPFESATDDPKRHENFNKANRESERLKIRLEELVKKVPCDYRRMTKEEKELFQLEPRNTKKVFIKQRINH